MSRYFFHMNHGVGFDPEGTELPDVAAAQTTAMKLVGQCLIDHAETFWDDPECTLTVTDEKKLTLFTVTVLGTRSPSIEITITASPAPLG